SGTHLATLTGHTDFVTAVAFSPDGQRVAACSWDRTVRVWDPGTGKPLATLHGHTNHVSAVAFSPDGQRLATASSNNTVRLARAGATPPRRVHPFLPRPPRHHPERGV